MRNLCRKLNLSTTGGRRALRNRLVNKKNALSTPPDTTDALTRDEEPRPPSSHSFNNEQVVQIIQFIQDSLDALLHQHQLTDARSLTAQILRTSTRVTTEPRAEPQPPIHSLVSNQPVAMDPSAQRLE